MDEAFLLYTRRIRFIFVVCLMFLVRAGDGRLYLSRPRIFSRAPYSSLQSHARYLSKVASKQRNYCVTLQREDVLCLQWYLIIA